MLAPPDLYSTFDVSIVGVSWTITAYNVAIVIGALMVLPLEQRLRGHVIAATGLGLFAVAPSLRAGELVPGVDRGTERAGHRCCALAGTVPVLAGIRGSDAGDRNLGGWPARSVWRWVRRSAAC